MNGQQQCFLVMGSDIAEHTDAHCHGDGHGFLFSEDRNGFVCRVCVSRNGGKSSALMVIFLRLMLRGANGPAAAKCCPPHSLLPPVAAASSFHPPLFFSSSLHPSFLSMFLCVNSLDVFVDGFHGDGPFEQVIVCCEPEKEAMPATHGQDVRSQRPLTSSPPSWRFIAIAGSHLVSLNLLATNENVSQIRFQLFSPHHVLKSSQKFAHT